jgi:hypothetical protein
MPIKRNTDTEAAPIEGDTPEATKATTASPNAVDVINEAYAREDEYMNTLTVDQLVGYANYQYNMGLPAGSRYDREDLISRIKVKRTGPKKVAMGSTHFMSVPVGYAKVTLNNPGNGKSAKGEYFNLNDIYIYWVPWDKEVILPLPLVDHIASLREIQLEQATPENGFKETYREVRAYPMNVVERNVDPDFEARQHASLVAGLEKSRQRRRDTEARRGLARQLAAG